MPRQLATVFRQAAFAGIAAIGLGAGQASAQQGGQPDAPSNSGFELVIVGGPPSLDREQFTKAILESLPTELTDPTANFRQSPAYRDDQPYRLIMIFHGDEPMAQENLCAGYGDVQAQPAPPPSDLTAATRVTSAFCQGEELLSQAESRMVGSIEPGQAGFKLLVADAAKQLFPDGFAEMPGTPATTTTTTTE